MDKLNLRSWFKDRKDNPVFWCQLRAVRESVQTAFKLKDIANSNPVPLLLKGDLTQPRNMPILLACCDEVYFYRFARQLALTAHEKSPCVRIHLHIFEPSPLCLEDAANFRRRIGDHLTISYEPVGRSTYATSSTFFFTSGRFAVAQRILETSQCPLLVIDVDGIVNKDILPELTALSAFDVGLILRPTRKKPWRIVLASAIYLNYTPKGRLFALHLAAAIANAVRTAPQYHTDQTVLYYLSELHRRHGTALRIAHLDDRWADHLFLPESLIWSAKGKRKIKLAHRSGVELDED